MESTQSRSTDSLAENEVSERHQARGRHAWFAILPCTVLLHISLLTLVRISDQAIEFTWWYELLGVWAPPLVALTIGARLRAAETIRLRELVFAVSGVCVLSGLHWKLIEAAAASI